MSMLGFSQNGHDGQNDVQDGNAVVRRKTSSLPVTKQQKARLEAARKVLAATTNGMRGSGSNSLLSLANSSGSLKQDQIRTRLIELNRAMLAGLAAVFESLKGITPGLESDYEVDERLLRAASQLLNGVIDDCALYTQATIDYMDVMVNTSENRQGVVRTAELLDTLVAQLTEVRAFLAEVASKDVRDSKVKKPSGT